MVLSEAGKGAEVEPVVTACDVEVQERAAELQLLSQSCLLEGIYGAPEIVKLVAY